MLGPKIRPFRGPDGQPDRRRVSEAIEANMAEYWLALGQTPNGDVSKTADIRWAYTGSPVLNRVVGARLSENNADDRIGEITQTFGDRRAAVTWLIGPSSRPHDLGARLTSHGFADCGTWKGMALPLRSLGIVPFTRTDIEIRHVEDPETLQVWIDVVSRGFELPPSAGESFNHFFSQVGFNSESPWRHLLGYVNGNPVAASTLFTAANVAGIYLVATVPEARGQGLATTLTWSSLREARSRGYELAVLQATEMGAKIYDKLGFREYCDIGIYRWEPRQPLWRRLRNAGLKRLIHKVMPSVHLNGTSTRHRNSHADHPFN